MGDLRLQAAGREWELQPGGEGPETPPETCTSGEVDLGRAGVGGGRALRDLGLRWLSGDPPAPADPRAPVPSPLCCPLFTSPPRPDLRPIEEVAALGVSGVTPSKIGKTGRYSLLPLPLLP